MPPDDLLRGAIRELVRHRPALFAEAVEWIVSHRRSEDAERREPPDAGGEHSLGQDETRDYGCVESLLLFWRETLETGFSISEVPDSERGRLALRALLTGWLLDSDAHFEPPAGIKSRPRELRDLPFLDVSMFMLLSDRFRFRTDPQWVELVRCAWKEVEATECLPSETAEEPAPARKSKPAGRAAVRALASLYWVQTEMPRLSPPESGPKKYDLKQWEYIREHECPAYKADDGGWLAPPSFKSWCRYIRLALAEEDSPKASPRAGRQYGSSVAPWDRI